LVPTVLRLADATPIDDMSSTREAVSVPVNGASLSMTTSLGPRASYATWFV
jgi:hypothetical protein